MAAKSSKVKPGRPRDPATIGLLRSMNLPDDFPLSPHAPSNRWYKKVRGVRHYYGPLNDPRAAEILYHQHKAAGFAGKPDKVRRVSGAVTVPDVCNVFLAAKRQLVDTSELSGTSWHHYYVTCRKLAQVLGRNVSVLDLTPDDFRALRAEFAKTCGAEALASNVQRTRTVFKFAFDEGMIDRPVKFGQTFKKPAPQAMRIARAAKPRKQYTAAQIVTLIGAADAQVKAMILLAINAGLGNEDVSRLQKRHLDLSAATMDYPRPKTGISRRAILWPETVEAIREALKVRPAPADPADDDLVFLTCFGRSWTRREVRKIDNPKPGKPEHRLHNVDSVRLRFNKLCDDHGVPALGFYALRHTFSTIAEGTHDFPAVERVMGHEKFGDMSTRYREMSDDRLRAVSEHVRGWLGLAHEDTAVLAKIG